MTGCSINECAALLERTPRQIVHAIRQGAPVLHSGGRGRGHRTLVDPAAVSDWLANRGDFSLPYRLKLADSLIRSCADSAVLTFRSTSGPHKPQLALAALRQFIETAAAIRKQLELPELQAHELPSEIQQIAKSVSILR